MIPRIESLKDRDLGLVPWSIAFGNAPEMASGDGGVLRITEVTPTRGFSAEFGAATTVLVASTMGLPISTTHTLVGGVIGVGFAQGIGALNISVVKNIVGSWLATVPVAMAVSAALFVAVRAIVL